MPEFIPQARLAGLDDFVSGYLEAAEFTMDEKLYDTHIVDWTNAAKKRAKKEVARFMEACKSIWPENTLDHVAQLYEDFYDNGGLASIGFRYTAAQCVGHDIWYVTQCHGVGFTDRGDHPDFQKLQDIGRKFRCDLNVWKTRNGYLQLEG